MALPWVSVSRSVVWILFLVLFLQNGCDISGTSLTRALARDCDSDGNVASAVSVAGDASRMLLLVCCWETSVSLIVHTVRGYGSCAAYCLHGTTAAAEKICSTSAPGHLSPKNCYRGRMHRCISLSASIASQSVENQ